MSNLHLEEENLFCKVVCGGCHIFGMGIQELLASNLCFILLEGSISRGCEVLESLVTG